jgi:hypothetical protein
MTAEKRLSPDDAFWALLTDEGFHISKIRELSETLTADFTDADSGFAQFADISDEAERAVASDQVAQSARAIGENLLEAQLHYEALKQIFGDDGLPYPSGADPRDYVRHGAEIDMHLTGMVRALGSALDCLAAVAIGVLRIPRSLQRAGLPTLVMQLRDQLLGKGKSHSADQEKSWQQFYDQIQSAASSPPVGWFDWLMGMRNLNVHRARLTRVMLGRPKDEHPVLIVFASEPIDLVKDARFDLHLRKRPHLPDAQDFITAPKAEDLFLNETAQTTLFGVLHVTAVFLEDAAAFLLDAWRQISSQLSDFPSPATQWGLEPDTATPFDGIAPGSKNMDAYEQLRGHPELAKRLVIAERLRPKP